MTLALDETELLTQIVLECWEQGCWLPNEIANSSLDAASQAELLRHSKKLKRIHGEGLGIDVPESRASDERDPEEDEIWIVTTQRCDLIKSRNQEPLITCIRAKKYTTDDATRKTARSSTLFLVRDNGEHAWVADLRQTINIPKDVLLNHQASQCLPNDKRIRRQFALFLGQRSWRRPVPKDIEQKIGMPIRTRLTESSEPAWRNFFHEVESVLIEELEGSSSLAIYVVLGKSSTDEAEKSRFFDEVLLPTLCPEEEDDSWLDLEKSMLVPANELLMTQVFDTYKLSLDDMSGEDDDDSSF